MKALRVYALDAWQSWQNFWFERDATLELSVFRTLFGLVLFSLYSIRTLDLEYFYSNSGIMDLTVLPELIKLDYRYSLFHVFSSVPALWVFNSIFLVGLLGLIFNRAPRFWAVVCLILHLSFIHRNPAGAFGADLIAGFYFLYLSIAGLGNRIFGSVGFRLAQIQLCIIYIYSGLHKLKSMYWWKGEALWHILINTQLARYDFSNVAHFPLFLVLGSFTTIIFEVYFPLFVTRPKWRTPALLFGLLLHLGIAFTLNIPHFSALMLAIYALYLDPQLLKKMDLFLSRILIFRRSALNSLDK